MRPFLFFLPFLLCYILLVFILADSVVVKDEGRYLMFAENIFQGFYSPQNEVNLWSGPGYPLILAPLMYIGAPLIMVRLLNAILYYLSVVFVYKTLEIYLKNKNALIFTILFSLYWLPYKTLPSILTETLVIFLISLIMYLCCKLLDNGESQLRHFWLLSFLISYLALTKVIFGYVIVVLCITSLTGYGIYRSPTFKKVSIIFWLALAFSTPYLIYTYSLTHKIFYWSNAGGMSLYWMSSPYEGEWGNWENSSFTTSKGVEGATDKYSKNHQSTYHKIYQYEGIERDEAFLQEALNNIKNYPEKFFRNWIANIGRMLFNFPFSYYPQQLNTYWTILPNMFLVVFGFLFIFPTIKYWRKLPLGIRFLLIYCAVYLFGSSLLSAYPRQFYVIVPIFILWLAFMFDKMVRINSLGK